MRTFIWQMLLIVWALCAVACGSGQPGVSERAGTVSIPLVTTAESGATYQLNPAQFTLLGPGGTQTLNGNAEVDLLEVDVNVGSYSLLLRNGWVMQRRAVGALVFEPIDALLLSDNPQSFEITEQQVTDVSFNFQVGEDLIAFGKGRLRVRFGVDEDLPECGDGIAEGSEPCDDGNVSNIDACSVACTTCAQHVGPALPSTVSGWPNSGMQLTAQANLTLHQFVFNNQGQADTISLTRSDGVVIATYAVPAGTLAYTVDAAVDLDAGQVYRLTSAVHNNGKFTTAPLPVLAGALQVDGAWNGPEAFLYPYWFNYTQIASCLR